MSGGVRGNGGDPVTYSISSTLRSDFKKIYITNEYLGFLRTMHESACIAALSMLWVVDGLWPVDAILFFPSIVRQTR